MRFTRWRRTLALGFVSWLLPFVFGFIIFPLKQRNTALFESLMALVIVITAALLGRRYFRDAMPMSMTEAALVGSVWLAVNLILDYPMFAYGPMQMTAAHYYSEIGAGYLLYPAFLAGGAWAFGRRTQMP
jgi:hypothetical protein